MTIDDVNGGGGSQGFSKGGPACSSSYFFSPRAVPAVDTPVNWGLAAIRAWSADERFMREVRQTPM